MLRRHWFQQSTAGGWLYDPDWWHPACDAVAEALVHGRPADPALRRLGAGRADLGCTVEETLDDVLALWRVLDGGEPPARVTRALLGGWAEAGMDRSENSCCTDTVTGLATRSHLQSRLGEMYREVPGDPPAAGYVLVVLDLCLPEPAGPGVAPGLARVGAVCRAAEVLRRAFPHGPVRARLAPARVAALVRSGRELSEGLATVEALLDSAPSGPGDAVTTCWVESLPRRWSLVSELLADLSR